MNFHVFVLEYPIPAQFGYNLSGQTDSGAGIACFCHSLVTSLIATSCTAKGCTTTSGYSSSYSYHGAQDWSKLAANRRVFQLRSHLNCLPLCKVNVEWFIWTLIHGFERAPLLFCCQVNAPWGSVPSFLMILKSEKYFLPWYTWACRNLNMSLKSPLFTVSCTTMATVYTDTAVQLEKEALQVPRYWMHKIGYIGFIPLPCLLFNFILDLLQWNGSYQDNFLLYPDGIRSTAWFQEYNIIL